MLSLQLAKQPRDSPTDRLREGGKHGGRGSFYIYCRRLVARLDEFFACSYDKLHRKIAALFAQPTLHTVFSQQT